jgi:dihydrofolate reductase
MRKIKILEHISLDGVISPGKQNEYSDDFTHGAWTAPYRNPAGLEAVMEAQGAVFDLLLGRSTYDLWAAYWPKAGNIPIANGINGATKYIATHRPDSLDWGPVKSLGKDIVEGVRNVKSQEGPDLIVWGSSTLTTLLLAQGLVDEVVLFVYPILLGRGKRLFADNVDPRELALINSKTTPSGVVINTFRHIGAMKTK